MVQLVIWLDNTLQIKETANVILDKGDFNFNVVDTPSEMRDIIYKLNDLNNKSRMVAGYCWKWVSKNDKTKFDICFPECDFKHQWNLANDGMTWIISKESVSEIGCIHTSQGLELENVGVIVGNDLIVRNGEIITNFKERDGNDSSIRGLVGLMNTNKVEAIKLADEIIKNTYRTLFTKGMKSCYVYFMDEETREYFKSKLYKSPI